MIRIPGICNGNPETTVLCHVRMAGITGTSTKAPDEIGAWGCSSCHDEVDRRSQKISFSEAFHYLLEGVIRTLDVLIRRGIVRHDNIRCKR